MATAVAQGARGDHAHSSDGECCNPDEGLDNQSDTVSFSEVDPFASHICTAGDGCSPDQGLDTQSETVILTEVDELSAAVKENSQIKIAQDIQTTESREHIKPSDISTGRDPSIKDIAPSVDIPASQTKAARASDNKDRQNNEGRQNKDVETSQKVDSKALVSNEAKQAIPTAPTINTAIPLAQVIQATRIINTGSNISASAISTGVLAKILDSAIKAETGNGIKQVSTTTGNIQSDTRAVSQQQSTRTEAAAKTSITNQIAQAIQTINNNLNKSQNRAQAVQAIVQNLRNGNEAATNNIARNKQTELVNKVTEVIQIKPQNLKPEAASAINRVINRAIEAARLMEQTPRAGIERSVNLKSDNLWRINKEGNIVRAKDPTIRELLRSRDDINLRNKDLRSDPKSRLKETNLRDINTREKILDRVVKADNQTKNRPENLVRNNKELQTKDKQNTKDELRVRSREFDKLKPEIKTEVKRSNFERFREQIEQRNLRKIDKILDGSLRDRVLRAKEVYAERLRERGDRKIEVSDRLLDKLLRRYDSRMDLQRRELNRQQNLVNNLRTDQNRFNSQADLSIRIKTIAVKDPVRQDRLNRITDLIRDRVRSGEISPLALRRLRRMNMTESLRERARTLREKPKLSAEERKALAKELYREKLATLKEERLNKNIKDREPKLKREVTREDRIKERGLKRRDRGEKRIDKKELEKTVERRLAKGDKEGLKTREVNKIKDLEIRINKLSPEKRSELILKNLDLFKTALKTKTPLPLPEALKALRQLTLLLKAENRLSEDQTRRILIQLEMLKGTKKKKKKKGEVDDGMEDTALERSEQEIIQECTELLLELSKMDVNNLPAEVPDKDITTEEFEAPAQMFVSASNEGPKKELDIVQAQAVDDSGKEAKEKRLRDF